MRRILILLCLMASLVFVSSVDAHPGRTDSSGCHTCRTNCESWGLSYGEYHCHGGSAPASSSYVAPTSTNPTITSVVRTPTFSPTTIPSPTPYILTEMDKKRIYRVVKVIDGDTFDIAFRGKNARVRLLGIDAPESVDPRKPVQCFSREAAKKLEGMVLNKYVRLVYDKSQGDKDKHQRFLRYAYLGDLFINKEMVVSGYAFSYKSYPTKYLNEFNKLEKKAKENNLGLWSSACNY